MKYSIELNSGNSFVQAVKSGFNLLQTVNKRYEFYVLILC